MSTLNRVGVQRSQCSLHLEHRLFAPHIPSCLQPSGLPARQHPVHLSFVIRVSIYPKQM
jgi:hypothetical protein